MAEQSPDAAAELCGDTRRLGRLQYLVSDGEPSSVSCILQQRESTIDFEVIAFILVNQAVYRFLQRAPVACGTASGQHWGKKISSKVKVFLAITCIPHINCCVFLVVSMTWKGVSSASSTSIIFVFTDTGTRI